MDPRINPNDGFPELLHGVRAGAKRGYKVFRTSDAIAATISTVRCPPTNVGTGKCYPYCVPGGPEHTSNWKSPLNGTSERCLHDLVDDLCGLTPQNPDRVLFNNRSDVFSVIDPHDGSPMTRWVAAIAAGFVTSGLSGQLA
jgi:hypothetical protein